ncbi:hypothetical protein FSP39_020609 [Pinctada imbricata]|uniref:GPR180-like N-terminal domain-containing protein n=1 Tax=Pinctada imbricata TaxID=66713 RepID=A0AA88Y1C3_PINIB|nr:hypothetical protein FSP39_020609 [Pinctada imbricata]
MASIRNLTLLGAFLLSLQVKTVFGEQCVIKGQVNTYLPWYGYLLQKTFQAQDAKVEYQITYPKKECCANLLIYYDDQIQELKETMSCQEREKIFPADNNQVIALSTVNATKGCTLWQEPGSEELIVCTGERSFRSSGPRTWYFAVSRCSGSALSQLNMNYYFNVTGYYGKCEPDPLTKTVIPAREPSEATVSLGSMIGLAVVCGIFAILAIIFFAIFVIGQVRSRKKKNKGGSVTSSQATMTQDIFYVNPSLSDREHSDCQYSHSQSSGSENYYEVIPDRRSYESINTQLAMQGQTVRGLNLNPGHLRDRTNIPPYILEDIPPPPYPGQNGGFHHRHCHPNAHHPGSGGHPHHSHAILNGHVQNGRPVQMHPSGHPPVNVIHQQHHSMSGLQTNSNAEKNKSDHNQNNPTNTKGNRSGSAPIHSDSVPIARPTPIYPSGSHILQFGSQRGPAPSAPPNGLLPAQGAISNVPNGHTNQAFQRQIPNGMPKTNSIPAGHNIQLQTYGQSQGQSSGQSQTLQNRQSLPNGNTAKLHQDAYRIQQFETTA